MSLTYYLSDDGINYIPVTLATPLPVTGGSGGGGGGTGEPSDPAWSGTGDGSVIAILKAMYTVMSITMTEVAEIDQDMDTVKALLQDIKTNTTPAG